MDPAYLILKHFKPSEGGDLHRLKYLLMVLKDLSISRTEALKLLNDMTSQGLLEKTQLRYQDNESRSQQQLLRDLAKRHLNLEKGANLTQDTIFTLTDKGKELKLQLGL